MLLTVIFANKTSILLFAYSCENRFVKTEDILLLLLLLDEKESCENRDHMRYIRSLRYASDR